MEQRQEHFPRLEPLIGSTEADEHMRGPLRKPTKTETGPHTITKTHGHMIVLKPKAPLNDSTYEAILEKNLLDLYIKALKQHPDSGASPIPINETSNGPVFFHSNDTRDDDLIHRANVNLLLFYLIANAPMQNPDHFPQADLPISSGAAVVVHNNDTGVDDSTHATPGDALSIRSEFIPQNLRQHLPYKLRVPGSRIPPECQVYYTNTGDNHTFLSCPIIKRSDTATLDLARGQLLPANVSNSHVLAIRNTPMCEAPTGTGQRVLCGQYNEWFLLGLVIVLSMFGLAWLKVRFHKKQQADEENAEGPAWPRTICVNSSEAKLREKVRKTRQGDERLDEKPSTEQYEPAPWRSASHRAARVKFLGSVEHDAGPVAVPPPRY